MEGHEAILTDMWNIMKGRIIITAAELDLFSHLHKRKTTAADLASRLGLDLRATARVLDCLVVFDLLKKDYDIYETTEVGGYLSKYHPEPPARTPTRRRRFPFFTISAICGIAGAR
jgi:predicted transcriptional regulator